MNIGILWDIENVTPPTGMDFIEAVLEAVSPGGHLSYAMAFGDWSNPRISGIATEMASNNFELIHMPHSGKKNSTDMLLIAHGIEIIFQYPNIDRFVLVSGDGDFRPLLLTQKKHGKETWVVCDVNNSASEDLIKMADRSLDYRDIIKEVEDFDDPSDLEVEATDTELSKERAFELFRETVGLMVKAGNVPASGGVKSRMKLLNPQFDEKALGYNSWSAFIQDAKDATQITYRDGVFELSGASDTTIPSVFKSLIDTLPADGSWILFEKVAHHIDFKNSGYRKFKDLALDAEKRGYVSIKNKAMSWSLKRNL
ncbi:MAG: NYN domain-containing protein [Eggerthellaceae bacterium]|nr:NYN domain-containing protein [Eggerthellaceae bacterium]